MSRGARQIIDTEPGIDSQSTRGILVSKEKVRGRIEFRNVTFAYPSRPDINVLENFSLVIEPGQWTNVCVLVYLHSVRPALATDVHRHSSERGLFCVILLVGFTTASLICHRRDGCLCRAVWLRQEHHLCYDPEAVQAEGVTATSTM